MCSVSIIVTAYNVARYLPAALASARAAASFVRNVEIIVVDDASTDGSADIARRFQPDVLVERPTNGGVLLATLDGIAAASGDIVCFLDGDDTWLPGKLAAVVEAFERDPALGMVTHDYEVIDSHGSVQPVAHQRPPFPSADSADQSAAIQRDIVLMCGHTWLGSAYAVQRRNVDLGAFSAWARSLPDPANTYQDWPLAYWIATSAAARFAYIDRRLFQYRVHGANHSGGAVASKARHLRNLRRTTNTLRAQRALAEDRVFPLREEALRRLDERLLENRYLELLFSGRRREASRDLARLLTEWPNARRTATELARYAGVLALGPAAFLAAKNELREFRQILRRVTKVARAS
jgi:glycosyltransferase involved in cell wall biosynthesis